MSETEKPPPDRRVLAMILSVLAAGALIYACVATWLYNPRNKAHIEVGFGLVSNYECTGEGECLKRSNSKLVADWEKELADIEKRADEDPADPTAQSFAHQAAVELRAPSVFPTLGYITLVCAGIAALSLL